MSSYFWAITAIIKVFLSKVTFLLNMASQEVQNWQNWRYACWLPKEAYIAYTKIAGSTGTYIQNRLQVLLNLKLPHLHTKKLHCKFLLFFSKFVLQSVVIIIRGETQGGWPPPKKKNNKKTETKNSDWQGNQRNWRGNYFHDLAN